MKKITALAALLILSGCANTSNMNETEQKVEDNVADVQAEVAEVVAPISLTVITNPNDARVRIMNIKPVYQDAIELKEGEYDIEVSKPGYQTYRKWVVVDKKTILTVNLDEVAKTEAAN
ncbi:PEGA domain-containing protein [Pseudoalteromonas sp. S3776]|uniref:PEGA domain-containing protein n=1 Tax=unclassified Pseudoalteromonas TaxID=194690 RepID=UPI0006D67418|nr:MULTISPECIES: PEGA domain-containing protein [unclassified Pseudoalteromonas]KPZ53690.1 PEGA domain protein [Pseudoalteromonas sp. P1-25]KPZ55526.1 PEGA domain protein [Pseudoalteromonas sp. P1-13-1a]KPZ59295.1 PEGA domain protein [Pseudoalteromonas sp. P1-7a]TMO75238.1 PEGA domain-containing protein [Pseudoalteromonas sp. S3785]TMO79450.1 PEGA domain-containing protein [Pseudoalteromonas sp. S3776]